jgi:class 3 adenylate cyclase/tetratricopeptide (TPR) repeat protein
LVSVLFVDLVGFTTYSEGRDPEDVRGMLSRYFEKAEEVIGLYGGVVEKFIGDAVMAVWGTPIAREDDAGRAVRAAFELVEAVQELGKSVGADLQARAGIYTGEAAVNLAAKGQGMVAGDTVNTASRLQSSADPGSVLVDRATYLGARDAIAFEPAGELTLKGKGGTVEAWRPLRVIAGMGGFRPADALEPAFTGRDEELRLIKDLLHASGRERKPRLASVMGIAGIGKSRLVWELFKYIDGLSDLIFWHQGRSPSYGEGVAFWALSEMVRMRARIAETDDDETAKAKLDECVDEYFPDEEDALWVKPHLQQLIGLGEGSQTNREQLFAAWSALFERIGELGTVIMVFEDLHWADPGLVDFVEHLMSSARNSPILIVTLARPELMDKRPTWGAGQRNFVSVHLEPLDQDDMNLLLKSVAGDLPGTVREEIIDRSEGVPLYAVEMVRMLVDRANLVADGDGYRWAGGAEEIAVPDSLHSLIASRLDSLSSEDRLLVQDASVLGKTFTLAALSAVAGAPAAELEPKLSDLVRREILLVDSDPRSPERGQYGFVQSLIREVAYQTLSNQNRRDRHVAAARFFAGTDEADMIDVVATHYVEAYNNSNKQDESAGGLAELARSSLVEAAARARSLGSNNQCVALLEKALPVTEEPSQRAEILFLAGSAASDAALFDVAIEHLQAAVALFDESDDYEKRAFVQGQLGTTYYLISRLDEAESVLLSAVEDLPDPDKSRAVAVLYTALARVYAFSGDPEKSERYATLGVAASERTDNLALIADAMITRAVGGVTTGRPREAEILLSGALEFSKRNGLAAQEVRALINMSANQNQIDPNEAAATGRAGADTARRYGLIDDAGFLLGNAIEASVHLGDWAWIREVMAEVGDSVEDNLALLMGGAIAEAFAGDLELAKRYGHKLEELARTSTSLQDQATAKAVKCLVAFVEGDYEGALDAASRGSGAVTLSEIAPYGILGRAAVWGGDLEEARRQLEITDASTLRNAWQRCRRLTLEACIVALEGDRERAAQLFEVALTEWDQLSIPLGKALCQMDFALTVGTPQAEEASRQAEAFFHEAGNEFFVRRLQDARTG